MISSLFRKDRVRIQAETLFGEISAQARNPSLFLAGGAPDTVEGRFEMLALHLFLAVRRLRADAPAHDKLSRAIQELFFQELDSALRELGVGDLSVGRKIRALAEAFYGRADAYDRAISEGSDALADAIARNALETDNAEKGRLLAGYVIAAVRKLDNENAGNLAAAIANLADIANQTLNCELSDDAK